MKTTLKAFTLMELLVAMVITSLLTLFSFSAFRIVQMQYHLYKNTTETLIDQKQFLSGIRRNVSEAVYWKVSNKQLLFLFSDYQCHYKFAPDYVTINYQFPNPPATTRTDTIKTVVQLNATSYANEQVVEGLIDYSELAVTAFGKTQTIRLNKFYTALDMLNYESQHRRISGQ